MLRDELALTGAKPGCGEGVCGACAVLMNGEPVHSCRTPVSSAIGRSITTVEGLARNGRLHPVQSAFARTGAMQCGYCSAGFVLAAVALLERTSKPSDEEIRGALEGNVCRCGTYLRIVEAVRDAARAVEASELAPPVTARGAPDDRLGRPRVPWDLVAASDRDYTEVLPPGLVCVLPGDTPNEAWWPQGGAWIHVGADDRVMAFTGKVDVGQDNRTALALRVARELRVSAERVEIVMGDTDLCPFDLGTFGSRSMPDAGETLARAAAGTRRALLEIAAGSWSVDPESLDARDGCIVALDGSKEASYGQIVGDASVVRTVAPDVPLGRAGDPDVSRPAPTAGALEVVTGARRYPSDLVRAGMLHGKVLRPPAFGASLRELDLSAARAIAGATVVHEEGFVGAAAEDADVARRAIAAVRAEWDLTPQPSGEELEAYLESHPVEEEGWGGSFDHRAGDLEAALASADHRIRARYTTAYIAHVPLETRVALAEWDDAGRLTVWTGTQRPFGVRHELAEELGVPETAVRVIVPPTGGGYGGKHTGEVAVEAARLARAAGRPVKVRWNREEEFTWAYFRPAAVIDVESGAMADGTLTAWSFTNLNSGSAGIDCPYDVGAQRIRYQPAASPLRQGSYRALAATANHFARECHVDVVAHALGIDPLELRLRNLSDERLAEVFRTAADRAGWPGRGAGGAMGIAGGIEKDGRVATVAEVRVEEDGVLRVTRIVTAFDCGAVVDPDNLANQIEGATVMGLGGALFERIRFADGRIADPHLADYRVPRISDVPPIEIVLVDRPEQPPAGAGETPIVAVAPAIANAIFAATGRRIRRMPLVPEGRLPNLDVR